MALSEGLKDLGSPNQPLSSAKLRRLSNCSLKEIEAAKDVWAIIAPAKRLQVLSRLVELAEEDIELDFSALFRHCLHDPDPEVRIKALEGLWECEDRSLMETILIMMRQDPAEQVRAAAAVALGPFVLLDEFGKLSPNDAAQLEEALFSVATDSQETIAVQRQAVESIGALSGERTQRVIQEAYENSNREMRISALYAMGQSCDSRWLPLVHANLRSRDPEMRYEATKALGTLGDETNISELLQLVNDDDLQVRLAAISGLGEIGGHVAKRRLQKLLESDETAVREAAEEALEELLLDEDPLKQP